MLCLSLTRTLFMTVVLLPLTLFAAPDKALLDLMKSKSLIGTFGFPSSGNVWMQEMLRFTPGISTTLDACVAKNGANAAKACTATSALSMMGKKSLYLKMMLLCDLETSPTLVKETSTLLQEVVKAKIWNTNRSYFVESNPRLTLRIPLLRQAADIFGDQKYLISIKHPICVSGGFPSGEWLQAALKNTSWSAYQDMLILLDVDGVKTSHEHQGKTLCETYAANSRGTSWLQFMKSVHDILSADEEWSLKHVRIVRYEDFQSRPIQLCQNMFKFLFVDNHEALRGAISDLTSPYFWGDQEIRQTCEGLFPKVKATRRLRRSSSSSHRRLGKKFTRTPLMGPNSKLTTAPDYNPNVINATCDFAMTQFQTAYHMFPKDVQAGLQALSEKMAPYGYSLDPEQLFTTASSKLEKWNLMNSKNKK